VQFLGIRRQVFTQSLQEACVLHKGLIPVHSLPCFAPVPGPSLHVPSVLQPALNQAVASTERPRRGAEGSSFQRLGAVDAADDRGRYRAVLERNIQNNRFFSKLSFC